MINESKWQRLFDMNRRGPRDELSLRHANFALAAQRVLEEAMLGLVRYVKKVTGENFLCLAGGVALNCVANSKLYASEIFDDIFIPPSPGDAGGACGAALAAYYIAGDRRYEGQVHPFNPSLGTHWSDLELQACLRKVKFRSNYYSDWNELMEEVSLFLQKGKVVGWIQGRSELGPRALGFRSILADPRHGVMQDKINRQIKGRESFRPFAPVVLEEDYDIYFYGSKPTPYMLFTSYLKPSWRNDVPRDYNNWGLTEKLNYKKSFFPDITHVDFSCRVQSVRADLNPYLYSLLLRFRADTGHSILLNTSFNRANEPIVDNVSDAFSCFTETIMDVLVIGNTIVIK